MNRRRAAFALLAVLAAGVTLWRLRSPATVRPLLVRPVPAVMEAAGKPRPVIFVGLDGGDWEMLDRLMAAGVMPNLARLVTEGSGGVLETIHPPLSPLVWTTMMTGVSPVEHGILDFTRFNPVTGRKEPITSDERRAPAVWNMATYAGRRVAVLGLWATYPAEPVNGLMVSDRLFSFLYKEDAPPPGVVFPSAEEAGAREALRRAERAIALPALRDYLPWLEAGEYDRLTGANAADPYSHPVAALRRILIETRVYHSLGTEAIRRDAPDLAVVYLQGTDSVGHVFAPFSPPRQKTITEEDYTRYRAVPERYFRHVDGLLGEYRKLAEVSGAVLMLASDHGFFWSDGRPTELSSFALATAGKWHRKDGIYLLWGPGVVRTPGHPHRGGAAQVCATLLSLLGLPPGRALAGPPLPGVETSRRAALDYREYYKPAAAAPALAARADQEAIEKLKALGYIGSSEATSAPAGSRGAVRTAGSYNNEGLVLRDQGKLGAAAVAFEKALALDPELSSALWNLSDVLFQQKEDPDRSDDLLIQAFAGGLPEARRYLVERAVAYQRAGDPARSQRLMGAALVAQPDAPQPWLFRGRYRVENGDCQGALADFRKAVALAPRNAAAHASEGLALLCLGDRAGARKSLARSLELDPEQPRVRKYLQEL